MLHPTLSVVFLLLTHTTVVTACENKDTKKYCNLNGQQVTPGVSYYQCTGRYCTCQETGFFSCKGVCTGRRIEELPPPEFFKPKRRLAFDDLEIRDPLCEWVLNDGLDSDWTMLKDDKIGEEEEKLLSECEETFRKPEDIAQCKFYVYAMEMYYTEDGDEDVLNVLQFDPEVDNTDTDSLYKRCGKVTVGLNDAIEGGEIDGVKIVERDGVDYFELDDPVDMSSEVALSAALSVGSMISAFIGATLVKVCRDFSPTDYSWLL